MLFFCFLLKHLLEIEIFCNINVFNVPFKQFNASFLNIFFLILFLFGGVKSLFGCILFAGNKSLNICISGSTLDFWNSNNLIDLN